MYVYICTMYCTLQCVHCTMYCTLQCVHCTMYCTCTILNLSSLVFLVYGTGTLVYITLLRKSSSLSGNLISANHKKVRISCDMLPLSNSLLLY